MCGATDQQKDIGDQQQQFYGELTNEYKQNFGQNQSILGALTKQFTPILQAGPGQEGFSAGEKEALNTQATEGTAGNYANAANTTNQILAARGGGNQYLPTGATAQLAAGNTQAAAAAQSNAQNTINLNDYAQGRQNWQQAASVLGGVAAGYDPTGYASAATGAGSAASSTANQIAQANNSVWQGALGAIGGVASKATYSSGAGFGLGAG